MRRYGALTVFYVSFFIFRLTNPKPALIACGSSCCGCSGGDQRRAERRCVRLQKTPSTLCRCRCFAGPHDVGVRLHWSAAWWWLAFFAVLVPRNYFGSFARVCVSLLPISCELICCRWSCVHYNVNCYYRCDSYSYSSIINQLLDEPAVLAPICSLLVSTLYAIACSRCVVVLADTPVSTAVLEMLRCHKSARTLC